MGRTVSTLTSQLSKPVFYSDLFDYPLTLSEIWFWQVNSHLSLAKVKKFFSRSFPKIRSYEGFYFLVGRRSLIKTRQQRTVYSQLKLDYAHKVVSALSKIPTIQAIFITGSLSMNNCPRYDDIDLMIVASPHTLWLTRFAVVVVLTLLGIRRSPSLPEHSSPRVNNKVCDNLYLDTHNLQIANQNLYQAHEILQAKCVFDRSQIHLQFLQQNSWVSNYLPVAFHQILKKARINHNPSTYYAGIWLGAINLFLFVIQFVYMWPKITSEKISLGSAFFHPQSQRKTKIPS